MKKIFIVDDDENILEALTALLETSGYIVETSTHGRQLHHLKKETAPDLIVLDVLLGEYDGREICKMLKNQRETKYIPILMFSAATDIERSAREALANDFLAKPFDSNDLLGKITQLTSHHEALLEPSLPQL